jgi:hypothetical protein
VRRERQLSENNKSLKQALLVQTVSTISHSKAIQRFENKTLLCMFAVHKSFICMCLRFDYPWLVMLKWIMRFNRDLSCREAMKFTTTI